MNIQDKATVMERLIIAIHRANPGAGVRAKLVKLNPVCDERAGTGQFRTAIFEVTAPGYRPTRMIGSVDSAGRVTVR